MTTKTANLTIASSTYYAKFMRELADEREKAETSETAPFYMPLAVRAEMPGQYEGVRLMTRWAWKWNRLTGRADFSGGVLLEAALPIPAWGSPLLGKQGRKTWRLGPGWNPDAYARMTHRATNWAIRNLRTLRYQEQLWRLMEAAPEGVRLEMEAMAEGRSLPLAYGDMTVETCEVYLDWMKANHPEVTTK